MLFLPGSDVRRGGQGRSRLSDERLVASAPTLRAECSEASLSAAPARVAYERSNRPKYSHVRLLHPCHWPHVLAHSFRAASVLLPGRFGGAPQERLSIADFISAVRSLLPLRPYYGDYCCEEADVIASDHTTCVNLVHGQRRFVHL